MADTDQIQPQLLQANQDRSSTTAVNIATYLLIEWLTEMVNKAEAAASAEGCQDGKDVTPGEQQIR